MFDEKFISEYKKIKAPDELYDKIQNAEAPQVKNNIRVYVKTAITVAAAFAVVLITAFALSDKGSIPDIYIGGEKLAEEVNITKASDNGIMLARSMDELSVDITLELKAETSLTASDGLLLSSEGELLTEGGNSISFSENVALKWMIPVPDTEKTYEIEFTDKNGTYFITLSFDSRAQIWNACLTK